MFPHGAQKALGWFGGPGFSGTMNMFTGHMHIPALFAFLASTTSFHLRISFEVHDVLAGDNRAVILGSLAPKLKRRGC